MHIHLFRFTHVLTTEISSRILSLLEHILNLKIKDCMMLIYDTKRWTHVYHERAIRMLQANVMPGTIAQQLQCFERTIKHLRNRF